MLINTTAEQEGHWESSAGISVTVTSSVVPCDTSSVITFHFPLISVVSVVTKSSNVSSLQFVIVLMG